MPCRQLLKAFTKIQSIFRRLLNIKSAVSDKPSLYNLDSTAEIEQWGKNHCKVCDMNFARRDLLLSHNLTFHVTEKKFACDQCDFKATLRDNLLKHIKSRHKGVKFQCDQCHYKANL